MEYASPMMVWTQDDKGDFKGHMIGPHNGHGIGFGDLNNDGRSDIVIGTGWYMKDQKVTHMHAHGSSINKAGPKGFLVLHWSAMSMAMERMICFGVMGMIMAFLHGFPGHR